MSGTKHRKEIELTCKTNILGALGAGLVTLTGIPPAGAEEKLVPGKDRIDVPAIGTGLCLHNLFQTGMVLQRDKPIRIWAAPGEKVTVTFGDKTQASTAAAGGPWITPELAMQKLVSSEVIVDGGPRIEEKLPQPEVVLGHYRDIAVFAMPAAMDSGFRVDQWQPKAGQRGGRNGRQPDLMPLPKDAAIPLDKIVNMTRHLRAGGTLTWNAPPGR
jgi:hypothetical protein